MRTVSVGRFWFLVQERNQFTLLSIQLKHYTFLFKQSIPRERERERYGERYQRVFHNSEQTWSIIALIREWLGLSVDQSPPPPHLHHSTPPILVSLSLSQSPMSCSTFCSVIYAQTFQPQQSRSLQNHSYHWAIKFCQKVRNNRNQINNNI